MKKLLLALLSVAFLGAVAQVVAQSSQPTEQKCCGCKKKKCGCDN